jgi:hypothetical protein
MTTTDMTTTDVTTTTTTTGGGGVHYEPCPTGSGDCDNVNAGPPGEECLNGPPPAPQPHVCAEPCSVPGDCPPNPNPTGAAPTCVVPAVVPGECMIPCTNPGLDCPSPGMLCVPWPTPAQPDYCMWP